MTKDQITSLGRLEEKSIAKKYGFKCLAGPYDETEIKMLKKVVKDAVERDVDYCIVQPDLGKEEFEIWRKDWTSDEEFRNQAIVNQWRVRV